MPRLTVLLPVRDGAPTVRRAVESTLRALPRDSELHVLDDASSDATPDVLASFADPRLVVHRAETASGVARGLNLLLERTDSELVGRMDADDITLPGRFAAQTRALAGADVVFTNVVEWTDGTRRVTPPSPHGVSVAAFPLHLLLTNPVAHPTMFARRSALDAVGGYREAPAEDYDLWLRLQVAGSRLRRLARPGLMYRRHAGQVTASTQWRLGSWRDPLTARAFGALAERVLGEPFPRLTTLAVDEPDRDEFERRLTRFAGAVIRAAAARPAPERRRVERLLTARTRAVRGVWRDAHPD